MFAFCEVKGRGKKGKKRKIMEGLQTELQDISENVTVFWVKHKDHMKDLYPLKNDQSPFIPKALSPFEKL